MEDKVWKKPDMEIEGRFEFRSVRQEEAKEAARIESICFPPNEASSEEHMVERIAAAPDLFLLAIDRSSGKIAGFLNGIATDEDSFRDEFFTDAKTHMSEGKNVMLLGLDVLPEYRRQGLAKELVYCFARREAENGRKRLVLTCLDSKVDMYIHFGFRDLGLSASVWGGEEWHEMDFLIV